MKNILESIGQGASAGQWPILLQQHFIIAERNGRGARVIGRAFPNSPTEVWYPPKILGRYLYWSPNNEQFIFWRRRLWHFSKKTESQSGKSF